MRILYTVGSLAPRTMFGIEKVPNKHPLHTRMNACCGWQEMASIRHNEHKKDPEIGKDMSCRSRTGKKKSGPMLICIFSNACKTLSR